MGDKQDTSLWHHKGDEYYCFPSWWHSFMVCQDHEGAWYWVETDHDGWDGEQVVDERMAESERRYATWQEAATDCEANNDLTG